MTTVINHPTQFQLKQAAYNSNIKSRALSVLIYLIDRTNKELTCFPSLATIGKNLHISLSTVKRAIKELVESGFLTKEARFSEKKNGGQTSNMYYIAIPAAKEKVEETTDKSVVVAEKVEVAHISFETIKAESKDLERKEEVIRDEDFENTKSEVNHIAKNFVIDSNDIKSLENHNESTFSKYIDIFSSCKNLSTNLKNSFMKYYKICKKE